MLPLLCLLPDLGYHLELNATVTKRDRDAKMMYSNCRKSQPYGAEGENDWRMEGWSRECGKAPLDRSDTL